MREPHYSPDVTASDTPAEQLADHCGLTVEIAQKALDYARKEHLIDDHDAADKLRRVFAFIAGTENKLLRLESVCIGLGLYGLSGDKTMTALAARLGVSKQRVSQEVNHFLDTFNLGRCAFSKTESARKSYANITTKSHWQRASHTERLK